MQFLPTESAPPAPPRTEHQPRFDDTLGRRHAAWTPADEPPGSEWSPAADIHETDRELTVTVELPGIAPDRVSVTAENGVVTIDGGRSPAHLGRTDGSYHLRERHNGPFTRRFRLPAGVDASAIRSDYADGLLTIHVPKAGLAARVVCAVTTTPTTASDQAVRGDDGARGVPIGTTAREAGAPPVRLDA